ncbi:MAG: hypothetical protein ACOC6H_03075 [Thermoproteota archaeon]
MGDYEVEISGEREDVLKTIEELPTLIADVQKAFKTTKPKRKAKLTVKTTSDKGKATSDQYPKIINPKNCSEAILQVLGTEWGRWRPRTVEELKRALKANDLEYPGRTLAGVLLSLVNKGKVRRWRTDAGCVYILAEEDDLQ